MAMSQQHVTAGTPMGATLVDGGATSRVWAPRAHEVYVARGDTRTYRPRPEDLLVPGPTSGHWAGFAPGVIDGTHYRFHVVGAGGDADLKRDPWARELEPGVPLADCDCVVRERAAHPWHDDGWRPPPFPDLVVHHLHVGVFTCAFCSSQSGVRSAPSCAGSGDRRSCVSTRLTGQHQAEDHRLVSSVAALSNKSSVEEGRGTTVPRDRLQGRMRATAAVQDLTEIPGGVQLAFGVTMTVDGAAEPACVATLLLRPYLRTVHRRENR